MKKIYIIQMHTYTIPARFIKLFTRYNYSHIAISFDKKCRKIYSFGRRKYNSVLDAGFVEEHKNGKFFKKFKETSCRIYELSVTNKQYKKLKDKILYMKKHEELFNYDYFGIFLRYFKLPIIFKNRYVCSYFVAKLLEEAGIWELPKESYFILPKDFEKLDNIIEIYSGKYMHYK